MILARKMKFAIQLYGHLRAYKECYKSIYKNIIQANPDFDFDIFIHTWDEIDCIQKPVHYRQKREFAGKKLAESDLQELKKLYNYKDIIVEPQITLSEDEINFINQNHFDINRGLILKNMAHTFCAVSNLRKKHEEKNNFEYDFVITTRPDIEFIQPIDFKPFYEKRDGWNFFKNLDKNVFSTYINNIASVISRENYIAGIDLLLFSSSKAANKLAELETCIKEVYKFGWMELSLTYMIQKHQLEHNYFYYEKDKNWVIRRINEKNFSSMKCKIINQLYIFLIPFLLYSKDYCSHIYLNVTKYRNYRKYLKKYLRS